MKYLSNMKVYYAEPCPQCMFILKEDVACIRLCGNINLTNTHGRKPKPFLQGVIQSMVRLDGSKSRVEYFVNEKLNTFDCLIHVYEADYAKKLYNILRKKVH